VIAKRTWAPTPSMTPATWPARRVIDADELMLRFVRALRLRGDEAAVSHRAAAIGGENRIEAVEEHHGALVHKAGQAADARAAHAIATDFPRLVDSIGPIFSGGHRQAGCLHPRSVVGRSAERRTKEAFADVVNLLRLDLIEVFAGEPGTDGHGAARF